MTERVRPWDRSLGRLRELRLLAMLLGDLTGEPGKTRTVETVGVSIRNLARFEQSRRLTPTLAGRWQGTYWREQRRRWSPSGRRDGSATVQLGASGTSPARIRYDLATAGRNPPGSWCTATRPRP